MAEENDLARELGVLEATAIGYRCYCSANGGGSHLCAGFGIRIQTPTVNNAESASTFFE